MSLIASLVLAASASTATLPSCSWDRPGVNPFMGDVVAAVDRYQDIAPATRAKLKARMKKREYDEIATIQRDGIRGTAQYAPEIRDMHFGRGTVCRTVTRAKWTAQHEERGLVYCEDGQCLIVPTVCRNVSRVTRLGPKPVAGAAQDVGPETVAMNAPTDAPLVFDPPAAGEAAATGAFAPVAQVPAVGATPGVQVPSLLSGGSPSFSSPTLGPSGVVPPLPPGSTTSTPGTGTPPVTNPPVFNPPVTSPPLVGPPSAPPVTTPIPEPGTWAMMAAGLVALAWRRRRTFSAR